MRTVILIAIAAALAPASLAKPPDGPLKQCIATLEEGIDFASRCGLHGGDVRCGHGKPMCCWKFPEGELCSDHPESEPHKKVTKPKADQAVKEHAR